MCCSTGNSPVIEETPDNSEGTVEDVGDNGHPGIEVVIVDEGEPEDLGKVGDDALRQLDPQEADPNLYN